MRGMWKEKGLGEMGREGEGWKGGGVGVPCDKQLVDEV